ncbi:hypothetical protein SRHO_G00007010 [Serrasalmus rhombeus]
MAEEEAIKTFLHLHLELQAASCDTEKRWKQLKEQQVANCQMVRSLLVSSNPRCVSSDQFCTELFKLARATTKNMAQLQHWCKGEGIDLDHALLVKDVPEDTEVGFIEETLQSIQALGRVRVQEHSDKPWRLMWKSVEQTEGLTELEENITAGTKSTPQICSPEAIIRAVGDLMEKQGRFSGESGAFRRLRTFSGVLPTRPGEEQFDSWVEQACLMVETSERQDKEKILKILESLKGPASEVVQAVRFDHPDASSQEYIDAIEKAFGTSETGEELYVAFRLLCQHPSEKLSEFLRHMERALKKKLCRDVVFQPQPLMCCALISYSREPRGLT